MIEPAWLILPAVFLFGWWVGRRSRLAKKSTGKQGLSSGYFEGLNYLLNEQPDRAIEVLVSMVEVDSETVETHLALGSLFRKQGEVERAIRIHQNLIARPTLLKPQRLQALMNLGLDYKQAGLNDRAVSLFEELALETAPHRDRALENLLEIYQHEQEWQKAIIVARKLHGRDPANQQALIGHFYAELAERAITESDLRGAAKMIRQIGSIAPHSPRYLLLQLKLARIRGKNRSALRWLNEIILHCPNQLMGILDELEDFYLAAGEQQQFLQRLTEVASDARTGSKLLCRIADIVQRKQGSHAALELLTQQVERLTDSRLSAKILSLTDLGDEPHGSKRLSGLIDGLVKGVLVETADYQCQQCGLVSRENHWRCPGCGAWDSLEFMEIN